MPISLLAKTALDLFIIKQHTKITHHEQGTRERYINRFHPFTFMDEKSKFFSQVIYIKVITHNHLSLLF